MHHVGKPSLLDIQKLVQWMAYDARRGRNQGDGTATPTINYPPPVAEENIGGAWGAWLGAQKNCDWAVLRRSRGATWGGDLA